jgi:uncharacterized protein (TIGR03437 family)
LLDFGQQSQVTVTANGQTSTAFPVSVALAASAIFKIGVAPSNQAAVLNQNLSVNGASNPAAVGSVISVYATGDGALSTTPPDGSLPSTLITIANASLTIGGQPAVISFAVSRVPQFR